MRRRRTVALVGAALLAVALMLSAGGCTSTSGDSTGTDTSSDLPPQDGLEIGTTAPDFRMQSQDQVTVALKDYAGTKNVIVVFYPADFTPV